MARNHFNVVVSFCFHKSLMLCDCLDANICPDFQMIAVLTDGIEFYQYFFW